MAGAKRTACRAEALAKAGGIPVEAYAPTRVFYCAPRAWQGLARPTRRAVVPCRAARRLLQYSWFRGIARRSGPSGRPGVRLAGLRFDEQTGDASVDDSTASKPLSGGRDRHRRPPAALPTTECPDRPLFL